MRCQSLVWASPILNENMKNSHSNPKQHTAVKPGHKHPPTPNSFRHSLCISIRLLLRGAVQSSSWGDYWREPPPESGPLSPQLDGSVLKGISHSPSCAKARLTWQQRLEATIWNQPQNWIPHERLKKIYYSWPHVMRTFVYFCPVKSKKKWDHICEIVETKSNIWIYQTIFH